MELKPYFLLAAAGVGGAIAQALGGWDMGLQALCVLMVADYLTGLAVAALWHKSNKSSSGALDSKAGFRGIAKKVTILILVWSGAMIDRWTGNDFLRDMICIFYIGNEGLSLLENTALMGVPYPQCVKNALEVLRQQGDAGKGGDR